MAVIAKAQETLIDLTDGYSVMLTSESYTFLGTTGSAKAGSCSTEIIAMRGSAQIPCSVDLSKATKPIGITLSKDTNATSPTITITASSDFTTAGDIVLPVSITGTDITINKRFSVSIAFTGATGPKGDTGATGAQGISVSKIVTYYKLQASSASAPASPASSTSGWSTTEPAFSAGSTNTLYTCEQSTYSNGSVVWGSVQKSSSYEAAKEAYNKSVTAQNTANSANNNANAIKNNIYVPNTTTINGGKIATGSVKAAQIDVDNLFAQTINATGTIKGATLISDKGRIAGWNIDTDAFWNKDEQSDNTHTAVLGNGTELNSIIFTDEDGNPYTDGNGVEYSMDDGVVLAVESAGANGVNPDVPFYVRNDGYAYLKKVYISGESGSKIDADLIVGKIRADQIDAQGIKVDAANIVGLLTADHIDVNSVFAKTIKTNGVSIGGTTLSAYKADIFEMSLDHPIFGQSIRMVPEITAGWPNNRLMYNAHIDYNSADNPPVDVLRVKDSGSAQNIRYMTVYLCEDCCVDLYIGKQNTHVTTNAYFNGNFNAQGYNNTSSRVIKTNIVPESEESARRILDLDVVKFDYKPGVCPDSSRFDRRGLIAEDTLNVMPEIVYIPDEYKKNGYTGDNTKVPSIDYTKLIPDLVKMVQIQQKQLDRVPKNTAGTTTLYFADSDHVIIFSRSQADATAVVRVCNAEFRESNPIFIKDVVFSIESDSWLVYIDKKTTGYLKVNYTITVQEES